MSLWKQSRFLSKVVPEHLSFFQKIKQIILLQSPVHQSVAHQGTQGKLDFQKKSVLQLLAFEANQWTHWVASLGTWVTIISSKDSMANKILLTKLVKNHEGWFAWLRFELNIQASISICSFGIPSSKAAFIPSQTDRVSFSQQLPPWTYLPPAPKQHPWEFLSTKPVLLP